MATTHLTREDIEADMDMLSEVDSAKDDANRYMDRAEEQTSSSSVGATTWMDLVGETSPPSDPSAQLEAAISSRSSAQNLLPAKMEIHDDSTVKSRFSIKYPLVLSTPGLCKTLYHSVNDFYSQLDKLEESGFALGIDSLPIDIPLAEPNDQEFFTGILLLYAAKAG